MIYVPFLPRGNGNCVAFRQHRRGTLKGVPLHRSQRQARTYVDGLYEKKLLTEEEMTWWRDFFEHQENTDWTNLGGMQLR